MPPADTTRTRTSYRVISEPLAPEDPYGDPAAFWAEQGKGMVAPWDPVRDATADQALQEADLLTVVAQLQYESGGGNREALLPDSDKPLWPRTIFEAGCGRGRLAMFFARNFPESQYSAIDVGEIQLAECRRVRPDAVALTKADITDVRLLDKIIRPWQPAPALPNGGPAFDLDHGYDLVLTSEVLMHVRPGDDLSIAFHNLQRLCNQNGKIIMIEWTPTQAELQAVATAYWNFPHNYEAMIIAGGGTVLKKVATRRQTIFLVQPSGGPASL